MRALFGLVSLLVVAFIVIYWFASSTSQISKPASQAKDEAAQMAGTDTATGGRASESADVDLIKTSAGKPDSILVINVTSGGAYERYFGLKKDDTILQVGPLSVKDHPAISSAEDAGNYLLEAYQKKQPLVVVRDGQQITLPKAGQAQQQPANNPNKGSGDPLQQQIEGIGARRGL